jgi:hypothetical protein
LVLVLRRRWRGRATPVGSGVNGDLLPWLVGCRRGSSNDSCEAYQQLGQNLGLVLALRQLVSRPAHRLLYRLEDF